MRKSFLLLALASVLMLSCQKQQPAPEPEKDSSAFVNLTDIIPDAILEIRYYSTYNFVGERIDGFDPIDSEWWHFTLRNEPFPDTYFDFSIRQL